MDEQRSREKWFKRFFDEHYAPILRGLAEVILESSDPEDPETPNADAVFYSARYADGPYGEMLTVDAVNMCRAKREAGGGDLSVEELIRRAKDIDYQDVVAAQEEDSVP